MYEGDREAMSDEREAKWVSPAGGLHFPIGFSEIFVVRRIAI